jgi:Domain of unknown function (DUF6901)
MNSNNAPNEYIDFVYKFAFEDGKEKNFTARINNSTLSLETEVKRTPPSWTKLKEFKCPHCPLPESEHEYCPVAVNLADVIDFFKDFFSYENVSLAIDTDARQYKKETSLQNGLSGLIGILMVTSGCPIMGKLRPMVRHHLPFASLEETQYRVLSMYLLAQYLKWKKGIEPDWEMKDLKTMYDDIRILNQNVCKKIRNLEHKDANINSVIILDNFANYINFNLDEDVLGDLEVIFRDYLKK